MSSHGHFAFVCLEPQHLAGTQISVTVHDRRWAACSAAVTETEHRWKAVDSMSMFEAACVMRSEYGRRRSAAHGGDGVEALAHARAEAAQRRLGPQGRTRRSKAP